MDYFAAGKLDPDVAEQVVAGFVTACRENDCALIGGETAEMPGMYAPTEYDIAGTIVGIVERDRILDKRNVRSGDVLVGLPSTGLHTNGYSLARAALLPHFPLDAHFDELDGTLADALLAVHRSYLHAILPLLDRQLVRALAHITGGGVVGNTMRVLPDRHALELDWDRWQRPRIFELIQELGGVPEEDMRRTFNLGIGMILIVGKEHVDTVLEHLAEEHPVVIGRVTGTPDDA
jgi:phosphoribosylformylglycinamidine cyclo-ligase